MKAHHSKKGYINPHLRTRLPNFWNIVRWRIKAGRQQRNDDFDQVKTIDLDLDSIHKPSSKPQVTWIGHSTVLIQHKGINVLTDPIFSDRASPFSFAGIKRFTKPAMRAPELPRLDAVVISHNHYDHLDVASVRAIGNSTHWYVPLGLASWFKKLGITNVTELDWWEEFELGDLVLTCTPAQHWSRRGFTDMNKSLWSSWAIKIDNFNFWFGGDTGYNESDFKEIGRRFGPFDAAAIPIGSYLPRFIMKTNHLSPAEAVIVHKDINSKYSFGIHWGTFLLSDENAQDPKNDLQRELKNANIPANKFETLAIGTTIVINNHL